MSTKIQINSLEALERLIGNDTELEIQVRNSVLQNFVNKHLKKIATLELVSDIGKAVQNELSSQFFETVKNGFNSSFVFKPEVLEKLKKSLDYHAQSAFTKIVYDALQEQKIQQKVNAELERATNYIMNSLADEHLEKRLDKMVEKKLKEKLGLS